MQRLTFNYSGLMDRPSYVAFNPLRLVLYRLVTSKYFDLAISAVIGLNIITMAMEFYMMPDVRDNQYYVYPTLKNSKYLLRSSTLVTCDSLLGTGLCSESVQLFLHHDILC